MRVSYLQIYNEDVCDLLGKNPTTKLEVGVVLVCPCICVSVCVCSQACVCIHMYMRTHTCVYIL